MNQDISPKIYAIKYLRETVSGLGLADAKTIVEATQDDTQNVIRRLTQDAQHDIATELTRIAAALEAQTKLQQDQNVLVERLVGAAERAYPEREEYDMVEHYDVIPKLKDGWTISVDEFPDGNTRFHMKRSRQPAPPTTTETEPEASVP